MHGAHLDCLRRHKHCLTRRVLRARDWQRQQPARGCAAPPPCATGSRRCSSDRRRSAAPCLTLWTDGNLQVNLRRVWGVDVPTCQRARRCTTVTPWYEERGSLTHLQCACCCSCLQFGSGSFALGSVKAHTAAVASRMTAAVAPAPRGRAEPVSSRAPAGLLACCCDPHGTLRLFAPRVGRARDWPFYLLGLSRHARRTRQLKPQRNRDRC